MKPRSYKEAGGWAGGRRGPLRLGLGLVMSLGVVAGGWGALVPPDQARAHWAFQAPREVRVPEVADERGWVKTELDRFILSRLEAAGVDPAPMAEPRVLIRRMSLDMTGLPPSPAEVEEFAAAAAGDREAAVRGLIDRLLASPRYGERWGRHWLDVARFSDTKGYVYGREERHFVHAPAYRDWVIRAFNDDLPYDRFLMLQLAADQVVAADSPDLAAMGFITGGRRFIGVTHDIIDDRIDVVTRGTMGLTVSCARCHDHKYDPIPTADYYSLYGVFHGSDDRLVPLGPVDDEVLLTRRGELADGMRARRDEAAARLRARAGEYLAAQFELKKFPEEGFDQILSADDLIPASVRRWRDFLHLSAGATDPLFAPWHAWVRSLAGGRPEEAEGVWSRVMAVPGINPLVAAELGRVPSTAAELVAQYRSVFEAAEAGSERPGAAEVRAFLRDPLGPAVVPDTAIVNNEMFFPSAVTEELWKLQGAVDRRLMELGTPAALVLEDGQARPNPRVFVRGQPSSLGDEVPRQFLEVLAGPQRRPFERGSGRLELARSIASADNPLVARVMVNRLWQHHFANGLVRTSSDFGLRAEAPSHPELLDWLARRFVADGWRVKAMHRLILSSAVYQQDARNNDPGSLKDADNRLLSRFPVQRLGFEALRDSMLLASGELDLTMGGRPRDLLEPDNLRRTVYSLVDRQFLPGTFRTFDFANPDLHVAVRHETTVPQQALYFLNGSFAAARARALARQSQGLGLEERVGQLHRVLYQRGATPAEVAAARRFVQLAEEEAAPAAPAPPPTPWQYGTGEYQEPAQRLAEFVPLPQPTGSAWQGAADYPGGVTGWAQLTALGGHPGNTRAHACVRRWVAPDDGTYAVSGVLRHEPEQGDGVRGFVVSSRHGELRSARVRASHADMTIGSVDLQAGDTLDFIVDIGDGLDSDQFLWEPAVVADGRHWRAGVDFAAPVPGPDYLLPWDQYAQVLLLANEFAFVE